MQSLRLRTFTVNIATAFLRHWVTMLTNRQAAAQVIPLTMVSAVNLEHQYSQTQRRFTACWHTLPTYKTTHVTCRRRETFPISGAPRQFPKDCLSSGGVDQSVTTRPRLNFDRKSSFSSAARRRNAISSLAGQRQTGSGASQCWWRGQVDNSAVLGPRTAYWPPVRPYPSSGFDSWRDRWQSTSACVCMCGR